MASNSAGRAILLAVAIFVLSQAIQRFVLEPLTDQRKVIGEIAGALLYLGNLANVSGIRAPRTGCCVASRTRGGHPHYTLTRRPPACEPVDDTSLRVLVSILHCA